MITGKNYIGNVLTSMGGVKFKTFNPQTNTENKIVFSEVTEMEIIQAVELSTKAFKIFKTISGVKKSEFLNEIANEIVALGDELIKMYCLETGLTEERALGERARTVLQLRSFANLVKEGSWVEAVIDTANLNRQPIPKVDIRKMLVPLGPIVVFGASNFPLAYSTAGGDTAAAFAAGCPVIVKSHPMHAGTGELVAAAIITAAEKTEMPNGVFSNLNSSGIEVGGFLVKNPQVKAIGFTGSISGGRALYNLAAQRVEPIPVFAEMGSINPVIILPKAAKNKGAEWAKIYANSITLGSGQFCTNPGLVLGIKGDDLSNFIHVLSEEILKIEPSCMLHPTIIGAYESNKVKMQEQKGLQITANLNNNVSVNYGQQVVATVEGITFLESTTLHHEVFGPFSMVVQCENMEQLEEIIVNLEGQLTGTILAENSELEKYASIISSLQNRVGRIIFNGVPTGVEVCQAMVHGGPYPASTDSRFTAVGVESIKRWVRPFCYQSWPNELLPCELKNENTLGISRIIDGVKTLKSL
mgnify:CR=1 FL=1|tara:strand:+ start:30942 stop:32525 length:1584 start_codon:yes stop_codon:yes gene_type:complete